MIFLKAMNVYKQFALIRDLKVHYSSPTIILVYFQCVYRKNDSSFIHL